MSLRIRVFIPIAEVAECHKCGEVLWARTKLELLRMVVEHRKDCKMYDDGTEKWMQERAKKLLEEEGRSI